MAMGQRVTITTEGLQALIDALQRRGYRVVGPSIRDQAIVYSDIDSIEDLPRGWTDEQDAGRYRLKRRKDQALFGYAAGPHSWKKFLHPPAQRLWRTERGPGGVQIVPEPVEGERYAFIGVRACELHAIAIQDRVFLGGPYGDPHYRARREGAFIVAVNCGTAGGTCFCVSMNTGPEVTGGFDLALTEILIDGQSLFVAETGAGEGQAVLAGLPSRPASQAELTAAQDIIAHTAASMGRALQTDGLPGLLMRNLDHPRWDQAASRCLTCANCTMVCPTCFCTTVEDSSSLDGSEASRARRWDSCFTMDFSYIHGGSVRSSAKSRYRQWMTHKLATWYDQFGTPGCVGCGRCITWCPVGIDITEEAAAIREGERMKADDHGGS